MKNISFIGLGNMGSPMALNLIKKKFKLNIFDINKSLYKSFINKKCKKANKLSELANDTKIFITMLPDGKALKKVILGNEGLIKFIEKKNRYFDNK